MPLPRCGLPLFALLTMLSLPLAHGAPSAAPTEAAGPPRRDISGDPLPPGAVARLGTARLRHGDAVTAVAFSPDGKTMASAGLDNVVRLWDTASGRPLHALRDHTNLVTGVAFSPDGKTLASSGWDNTLHLWDVASGKNLRTIRERRHPMSCVAFAPDGKIVATAGADGTVRLWDPGTGEEVRRCTGHRGDIRHLSFSPDGKMLATGGLDRTVRFWDPANGREIGNIQAPPVRAGSGAVSPLAFSPDGKRFAVALLGGTLKIYDGKAAEVLATFDGTPGEIRSLAFSPDGRALVAACSRQGVQRWDLTTSKKAGSFGSPRNAACVAIHGQTLATGEGNTIRLWDMANGKELPRGDGHRDAILALAFVDKGKHLATGGGDGELRFWDPRTGRMVRRLPQQRGAVQALAFEPGAGLLASGSMDTAVRLWRTDTGEMARELAGKDLGIFSLAFAPDGKTLAVGSRGPAVHLWDVAAGHEVRSVGVHPRGGVHGLAFTPDGQTLVSGGGSGNAVFIWDVKTGARRHQLEGSFGPLALALSPDGKSLATTAMSKVRLWEMDMARKLGEVTADSHQVHGVAFSPDGKLLATGGKNASLRLWDWADKKELGDLSGHEGAVLAVAFSPDGKYLASAGGDGVALVWDVADVLKNPPKAVPPSRKPAGGAASKPAEAGAAGALPLGALARLGSTQFRHSGAVQALAFNGDGSILAAGGADGRVRLWDAATGKERRRLPAGNGNVLEVFFADGGKALVVRDFDSVRVWDAAGRDELARLGGDRSLAGPFAVSPDGALVAVSVGERFSDPRIRLRGVAKGKSIKILEGHTGGLLALTFSPDGKTLASSSMDETIRLWDVAAGKETTKWTGHDRGARPLVFSPDGKKLASVGLDGVVRLWDVATGKNVQTWQAIPGFGRTAVFAPDGDTLALGLANGAIQLMNCDDGKIKRSWRVAPVMVTALTFSADGKTLAAGFQTGPIRLYDAATGQEKTRPEGHVQAIAQLAYLPDGKTLATLSGDASVRFWDLATHKEVRKIEHLGYQGRIARFSGDGRRLVSALAGGRLKVWDTATGGSGWETKAPVRATAVALSANGKRVAYGQPDGSVYLTNEDGPKEGHKFRGLRLPPSRLAFSPDGTLLVGQSGRLLLVWDVAGWESMQSIDLQTPASCELIFAPDGRSLATLGGDNVVRLWELASRQLRTSFTGHRSGVSSAVFSPDGKLLITAGFDRTLRSWDLATGESLNVLEQPAVAMALACSPDGRTLASGNDDTTTLLWDAARLRRKGERPVVKLDPSAQDRLWTELTSDNAAQAYGAMRRLAGSPDQAVTLLRDRLGKLLDEEAKRVRQLLAQLDSDSFSERERATEELLRLGRRAEAPLRKALDGKPSVELRRRAGELLEKLRAPEKRATPPLTLACLRGVEVLERLDTPEARQLLKRWAEGSADEPRTQAARTALARLSKATSTKPPSPETPRSRQ